MVVETTDNCTLLLLIRTT